MIKKKKALASLRAAYSVLFMYDNSDVNYPIIITERYGTLGLLR